jgi:uncharacterized ion transporter superfamily protein YfcC
MIDNEGEKEENKKIESLEIINPVSSLATPLREEQDQKVEEEKKSSCQFPTAYTILVIIEILVFILTFIIPKGKYDTIEYSSEKNTFIIKSYNIDDKPEPPTEDTLKKYNIKIPLENFLNGYIKKPISIPGTYQRIENETTNILKLFLYPILGLIESSDISFFLLILGGNINILIEMNALSAGMEALSRLTKGREFLLLCLVFIIISLGGSICGMSEEILAFYPILMPIFLKSGLDGILGAASLYIATLVGNMFSIVNAFSVVLASYSAGISFTQGIVFRSINYVIGIIITILYFYFYYRRIKSDEKRSCCYEVKKSIEDKFLKNEKEEKPDIEKGATNEDNPLLNKPKENKKKEFTCIQKISLIIFISGFIVVIIGVLVLEWWFEQMASVFFIFGIILMFLLRKGEVKGIEAFTRGAGDFCGVIIIIGIARGINITLEDGKIADTILYGLTNVVQNLPRVIFAALMFIIFNFLGFFIQSYTGLAVLSMPVLAPLADEVNCSRTVVVNAYIFGQSFIGIIAPTGLTLIILQMIGLKFNHWIKFIYPYMIIFFIYLTILIMINSFL